MDKAANLRKPVGIIQVEMCIWLLAISFWHLAVPDFYFLWMNFKAT